ncbi:hypothetical protein [Leptothoe spongobia]|uniref:Uncharacterized protein n=1 Tax=Leptothoe spongobia TAU-MAC 1115 TaxID=1967444 RepID=A0A947GP03_9CYAN|nr:hypothetical protein [Leptothoe spongobia]MBT9316301.1 hypothetical protein [Leptothoe spongobia TAU-MAC 1115]
MHQLTISSNKYPGIQMRVPDLPGFPGKSKPQEGVGGVVTWHRDQTYLVTDATKEAIEREFDLFPGRVSRHYNLVWTALTPAPAENKEAAPEPAAAKTPPAELSAEDKDLIDIEVGKLLGKTIAEATPVLTATATNVDIALNLRIAYLQAVIAHDDIQKGLQDEAEDLLEQIQPAA